MTRAALVPYAGVTQTSAGLVATTSAPQLELVLPQGVPGGCWISLTYRTSFLDHLVRPLIMFETSAGLDWDVMSAGVFGRTGWIGRVPDDAHRILISPVDQPGPFGFEIEGCQIVARWRLLARALRNDLQTAAMALGARFILARQETRQALMFARGGVAMAHYARWRAARSRAFEPFGLDAPRFDADGSPHVCFVIMADARRTCVDGWPMIQSLLVSSFENWSLRIVGDASVISPVPARLASRTTVVPEGTGLACALTGLARDDLVICAQASDRIADFALPVVAAAAVRQAGADCLYGDEDALDESGQPVAPRFKPDWSPVFEAAQAYLGRPVFWRARFLAQMADGPVWFDTPAWRQSALRACAARQVWHIRRVLMTCAAVPKHAAPRRKRCGLPSAGTPFVSIIIPTRDQLALLKECLDGLLRQTGYPSFEIVIVDHESAASTLAFYKTLVDPRIRILPASGRFNFSAMCNAGASVAAGDCLVFLNNDISIIDPDWLTCLVMQAMRPDAGAVGARLLFSTGKIQHAGVTVGLGGYADHTSHGAAADAGGYLGRLSGLHEASAVTGACIAVETCKFQAVGGFNADNLPVELNDIDLCLRLKARGWTTLMCPDAVLVHHQSASRGFSYRPFTRYGQERRYFRGQWRHVIRDDPYFHPALSLFSVTPALDG